MAFYAVTQRERQKVSECVRERERETVSASERARERPPRADRRGAAVRGVRGIGDLQWTIAVGRTWYT